MVIQNNTPAGEQPKMVSCVRLSPVESLVTRQQEGTELHAIADYSECLATCYSTLTRVHA